VAASGGKVVMANHPVAVSRGEPPEADGGAKAVAQLSDVQSIQ
jgi:hypothetical protein